MGEGFSDYLAAAIAEEFAPRDDYDECFAEWDYSSDRPRRRPALPAPRGPRHHLRPGAGRAGLLGPRRVHLLRGRGVVGRAVGHPHALGIADAVADRKVIESHDSLTPQSDLHAGCAGAGGRLRRRIPQQAAVRDAAQPARAARHRAPGRHPGGGHAAGGARLAHRLPAVRARQRRRAAASALTAGPGRGGPAARLGRRLRPAPAAARARRRSTSPAPWSTRRRPPGSNEDLFHTPVQHRPLLPRRARLPGPGQLLGARC